MNFFKLHYNSKEALGESCEATSAENHQRWRLVWTLHVAVSFAVQNVENFAGLTIPSRNAGGI